MAAKAETNSALVSINSVPKAKRKLILDIETSDPDDIWNLFLVAGHPGVEIQAVTVCPGSPAQLLMVHAALERLAAEDASLAYLGAVPLGHLDIDSGGSVADPTAATQGRLYADFFPKWHGEVLSVFGGNGSASTRRGEQSSRGVPDAAASTGHKRLKAHVLHKLQKAGREVSEGWQLLLRFCDVNTTLMTGGPVGNLGRAIQESRRRATGTGAGALTLGRWVSQGGFAGANVVPKTAVTLPRFRGELTQPAWNFDLDRASAVLALEYGGIRERFIVSKNVCHQTGYDAALHQDVRQAASSCMQTSASKSAAGSGGSSSAAPSVPRKPSRWQRQSKDKREAAVDGEVGVPADEIVASASSSIGASATKPAELVAHLPSLGLRLFHEMVGMYKRADGKKLHDLVAGLCAVDPALCGCAFRRVNFRWLETQPDVVSYWKDGSVAGHRHKGGGEWGCLYAVSEPVWFSRGPESGAEGSDCKERMQRMRNETVMPGPGLAAKAARSDSAVTWNAWISVDIDLPVFRQGLVGGGP